MVLVFLEQQKHTIKAFKFRFLKPFSGVLLLVPITGGDIIVVELFF